MKIVIIAPEHPNTPLYGGIARYLRDYIPELAKHEKVYLISLESGKDIPDVEQFIISAIPLPSPLLPLYCSRCINKILSKLQPDCVEYANWLGLGCLDKGPWAKVIRLSTPVVHGTLRPGLLPKLARPIHHYWEMLTARNADLWISNTEENLKTCQVVYKILKPSVIINHGAKLPISSINNSNRDILFVGRYEGRKGIDILLDAWCKACKDPKYDGRKLHLVGRDMPGESGSYLQDCLKNHLPPPNSYIVHGEIDEKKLNDLRSNCAISVIPSRYESFGMVALEAFAAGHAVIASSTGGLTEVVENEKSGLLFPNEDSGSLASTIIRLIADDGIRVKLAQGGQDALIERFSIETMVKRSIDAYQQACSVAQNKAK